MAILSLLFHCSLSCLLPPLHSKPASLPFLKHQSFLIPPSPLAFAALNVWQVPHPSTPNPCSYSQNSLSLSVFKYCHIFWLQQFISINISTMLTSQAFIFPLIGLLVSPSNSTLACVFMLIDHHVTEQNSTLAEISDNLFPVVSSVPRNPAQHIVHI